MLGDAIVVVGVVDVVVAVVVGGGGSGSGVALLYRKGKVQSWTLRAVGSKVGIGTFRWPRQMMTRLVGWLAGVSQKLVLFPPRWRR